MVTRTVFRVLASSALLCMGVLCAPVSSAGETLISAKYAGSGWDTHVDGFVPDERTVSLTLVTQKGTFGNATLTITTEWVDDARVPCPDGYPVKVALVYASTVTTFADQSQLFGVSQSGWICGNPEGGYFGEVSGAYVGGTGRFEGATGDYVSKFDGAYLEPNLGFRSIRGTVKGSVGRK